MLAVYQNYHKVQKPWLPKKSWLLWLGSLLGLGLLSVVSVSCNECTEENQAKCDDSCSRHADCEITYSYNDKGDLIKLTRSCRWVETEDVTKCGTCSQQQRNEKNKLLSQHCVACNVCNKEFQCLEDKDCKENAPYCRSGICSACKTSNDCKDKNRPLCTDAGCTCTQNSDCPGDTLPVCTNDKDSKNPKRCGCSKDGDCGKKEYPVCLVDEQICGCSKDADCKDINYPQCYEKKCVVCRCPTIQPKRPFCLKKTDGSVVCAECLEDNECTTPGLRRCDTVSNSCVSCKQDSDCKDTDKPSCDKETGTCVSCRCAKLDPSKPVCLKQADDTVLCVACVKDDNCQAPTPKCNVSKNQCESACQKDGDCANNQFCVQGQCVSCRDRNDCQDPQLPRCVSGTCQCLNDKDCPGEFPVCSDSGKRCVECQKNGDCSAGFPVCSVSGVCELLSCDPANGGKECVSVPGRPYCRQLGRRFHCVGCTKDSECQNNEGCDLSKFICGSK